MVPWASLKQHSENVEPQKKKRRRNPRWRKGKIGDRKKKKVTTTTRRVLPLRSKNRHLSSSSLKKLCDAATKAREQRPRRLRISRTVELLSQKDDGWRKPQSKLLFMTALGLTPILHKAGVPHLSCTVNRLQLQPSTLDTKLQTVRVKSKSNVTERICVQPESEIEVIDLTLDNENEIRNVTTSLHHRYPVLYQLFSLIQRIENRDKTTTRLLPPSRSCQSKSKSEDSEDDVVFLSQQTTDDEDVVILT